MNLVEVLAEYEEMLRERYSQYARLKSRGRARRGGRNTMVHDNGAVVYDRPAPGQGPLARHREVKVFAKTELAALYGSLYGGGPGPPCGALRGS